MATATDLTKPISQYNRELSPNELETLKKEAEDWACAHGLVMYSKQSMKLVHAPTTLVPYPFPKKLFNQAWNVMSLFNTLVQKISNNPNFILDALKEIDIVEDSFTGSLIQIMKTVMQEGIRQLGIHRSDYMLDYGTELTIKQVELNTIAASLGQVSYLVGDLHRFLLDRIGIPGYSSSQIPKNENFSEFPRAFHTAWKLFEERHNNNQGTSVVVMVVHANEFNVYDQRWIEYNLWDRYKVKTIRRSLQDISERAALDSNHNLILDGHVVSIMYFRAGYAPDDYPSEKEWAARLLIERSTAIKCPSIQYHLAGSKKIQQVLANPGVLEKFLPLAECQALRSVFAGLYSLDSDEERIDDIIKKAIATPHDFVMKPQREGGGNNLFDNNLRDALIDFTPQKRAAYILMDRIRFPSIKTFMLRESNILPSTAACELGIYGVFVGEGDKEYLNNTCGWLMRTKIASMDEGGVAVGIAVLDSPYLVDTDQL